MPPPNLRIVAAVIVLFTAQAAMAKTPKTLPGAPLTAAQSVERRMPALLQASPNALGIGRD